MGWWQVNADTLAGSRFVISPLAEAMASLKLLEQGVGGNPADRAWLDVHLPEYQRHLDADPITTLLVRAAIGSKWNATFITPTPTLVSEPTFAQELAHIRETPAQTALDDLAMSLGGPLPTELRRSDLAERAADLLEWTWTTAVLPYWPQRRRIAEADIVARTAQLSQGGWAAALDDMRPGMRWLGRSRLQITAHDYPPLELTGANLMFVPVTPCQSWVSWDTSPIRGSSHSQHRYAVIYPCSGVLAEAGRTSAPTALARLLGPMRAGVLVLLDTPKTTTQLVTLTNQGLGSVGRHLKVLFDAQLIQRRRTGRSVLYFRTDAGEVLVRAQPDT
ncbi:ArsR/SmtB family transcription factor [Kitasatospora brasiliensis]|uniref:ArsR/SmtB family transcription factor n=1 Tax=Kitasatospora brasiliensis TaxID=3058040 RepID=UPI00292DD496|nr:winged helix-turn-helix domain-containing protein [Kitasatospora sp. K002]